MLCDDLTTFFPKLSFTHFLPFHPSLMVSGETVLSLQLNCRPLEKGRGASLVALMVKNLPAMQKTRV